MRWRRFRVWFRARTAALAVGTVALAGCDNNPLPAPLAERRPDGAPWMVASRAVPDEPRSLDPQVTYDDLSHYLVGLTYETLLEYHPFKEDYELIPSLAASLPVAESRPDGTVSYLCRIKPGIFFNDDPCFVATGGRGRELVAADFLYTFQRIADPAVECPIFSTLQEYLPGLREAYAEASRTGTFRYDRPLACLELVDRHTFRLHLSRPYPQIKYWLAFHFTAPVPREAVEYYDGRVHNGVARDQFRFHPVGTGPFRLVEWSRGRLLRLARNERYRTTVFPSDGWPAALETRFRPRAGAALPFYDEIQLQIIRESIPAWVLFKQGYLDASGIGKDVFHSVINVAHDLTPEYRRRGVHLYKDVDMSTFYLMFNMQDPVVGGNQRKVRQALSLVFDAAAENDIFRNGVDLLAQQFIPPHVFGHDADWQNPWRQTNVTRARQLLSEAGYPDGIDPRTGAPLEITLDITADDAVRRQAAEFEKRQFEQLGIRVRIQENLWAQHQEKMIKGQYQMTISGWKADYPDPENFYMLFYSRNLPPAGYNHSLYNNPQFDALFEQMATMEDGPERLAIIRRMRDLLTEDCVVAPLFHPVHYTLSQPWAPRVVFNSLAASSTGSKYGFIDVAQRARARRDWNRKSWWPLIGGAALFLGLAVLGAAGAARRKC